MNKYRRKTEKRDDDVIRRALGAISIGMTLKAAAREFGIPARTLRRHRDGNLAMIESIQKSLRLKKSTERASTAEAEPPTTTATATSSSISKPKTTSATAAMLSSAPLNFSIKHAGRNTVSEHS